MTIHSRAISGLKSAITASSGLPSWLGSRVAHSTPQAPPPGVVLAIRRMHPGARRLVARGAPSGPEALGVRRGGFAALVRRLERTAGSSPRQSERGSLVMFRSSCTREAAGPRRTELIPFSLILVHAGSRIGISRSGNTVRPGC